MTATNTLLRECLATAILTALCVYLTLGFTKERKFRIHGCHQGFVFPQHAICNAEILRRLRPRRVTHGGHCQAQTALMFSDKRDPKVWDEPFRNLQ